MSTIESLKKFGKTLYNIYFCIGAAAMALLAALVVFTVIARYFFSLSWKELSEFNVTLFAFTTFWGLGLNILNDEHVVIDMVYDGLPIKIKRIMSVINYVIVLVVTWVFTFQSYKYVQMAGKQKSMGMEIPMKYMYGIMPVCGAICLVCVIIKLFMIMTAKDDYFAPKNVILTEDDK